MKRISAVLALFLASLILSASEPLPLRISASVIDHPIRVGTEPFLLVTITNTTGKRLFIDDFDFETVTAVTYQDLQIFFGPTVVRGRGITSHGGVQPIRHVHERTFGIEPGESLIRFAQLYSYMLVRPERVTATVRVRFPGTTDLSTKPDEWSEYVCTTELALTLSPSQTK
jgi:hypothetical protein